MAAHKPKSKIRLQDVIFYFDAEERTRLDQGGVGRKTGEILTLRDKLLALPDSQFDAAIKTLKRLVEHPDVRGESVPAIERRNQGIQLFREVSEVSSGSGATEKVSIL